MRRAQRIDENSKKFSSHKKTYSMGHTRTVDGNLENSKKLSFSVKNKKKHSRRRIRGLRQECISLRQVTSDIVVRHMAVLRGRIDDAVLFCCKKAPKDFGKRRREILRTALSTRLIVRLIVSRHVPAFLNWVPARETHSQGKQPTESFYGGVWRLQGKRGGRERERERERERTLAFSMINDSTVIN